MIAFKAVSIVAHGRTYNGTYLRDLGQINVSSAYGSKTAKVSKREETDAVAKAMLAELLEAWRP